MGAAERFPTETDVDSGRTFRYIHIQVNPSLVSLTASGEFRAERGRHGVTLGNLVNQRLGEPMLHSFSLGHWTGRIYDHADRFDEMKSKALQFARERQRAQAEELRRYAQLLEEQPAVFQERTPDVK